MVLLVEMPVQPLLLAALEAVGEVAVSQVRPEKKMGRLVTLLLLAHHKAIMAEMVISVVRDMVLEGVVELQRLEVMGLLLTEAMAALELHPLSQAHQ